MSGDLISVRLICVAATQPLLDLWQQGAAMASVPVEFSAALGGSVAVAVLGGGPVDICIVDSELPPAERARVVTTARNAIPPIFIVACTPYAGKHIDGVDHVLPCPREQQDARRLVEVCLRVKVPTSVLVVDDSITMRSIVRKILVASRFALDVHEANEGYAAIEQLRKGRFGVVFLDYNMPGFNGIETLSEIRHTIPGVAVVMMTSTLDNAVAERARATGALGFLKKPFYPADVDALLERHFGLQATIT